ncbi:protein PAXX isoform X11 [Lutra lutra]|uniref:protein PAXX isoform X11 n=1 Tax=Lutra lutra TaxID=9657 RepID=UPI001FD3C4AF|nr:protein PAXX isoform X11 [Lutra lutra]
MVPPPLSPPLCTLPPGPGPPRFVCFCEGEGEDGGPGAFNLYVTDAAELWSTCFTADSLAALVGSGAPGRARKPPAPPTAVPGPEAASRLQALTLRLADQVCTLTRQLAAAEVTAASPRKSPGLGPQFLLPDPDPQRGGPGLGVRRRCPGESLINPGFKSKKPAGGVDFESP